MKFSILIILIIVTQTLGKILLTSEYWGNFKKTHSKNYKDEAEEEKRLVIFTRNMQKVKEHNKLYDMGLKSFKLGMNKYADLEHHEFVKVMYNGLKYNHTEYVKKKSIEINGTNVFVYPNITLPDSIDWRAKGAVTEVKAQGLCGACYTFSAAGAMEGQYFLKTGKLMSLSAQNLLDCSTPYGNTGCDGGLMDNAFKYIKDNGGIATEDAYPYEAKLDKCRPILKQIGISSNLGYVDIEQGNEEHLKAALATIGPISAAMDANHPSLQLYSEGVYHEPKCSSEMVNHAVLAVGYGTENGHDYWIIKNSWGPQWGDGGYVKVARNKNNHCGIATLTSYPVL